MLLSDRDILAAQADGHISLDPWTPEMVQPASIDVRLDRFFRLFNNHAYTYVDPAENQGALTEQFEVQPDEPWILHPGEFALASTWEYVKLDPTISGRQELAGPLGYPHPFHRRFQRSRFRRAYHARAVECEHLAGQTVAGHENRPDVLLPAELPRRTPIRVEGYRLALSRTARADSVAFVYQLLPRESRRLSPGSPRIPHVPLVFRRHVCVSAV